MSDRHAFLAAIAADPESDTPRLVFADWLEERGESRRAEFIRVQCELALLEPGSEKRRELQRRADAIFDPAWPAPPGVAAWGWHRGFAWNWRVSDGAFLDAIASPGWEPSFDVGLEPRDGGRIEVAERLALNPRLGLVGTLALGDSAGAGYAGVLLSSPHWRMLHTVWLGRTVFGAAVRALCDSPAPFRLTGLSAGVGNYDPPGDPAPFCAALHLVATAARFAELRSLWLGLAVPFDEVAAILLASPTLPRSLRLTVAVDSWPLTFEPAGALGARFDFHPIYQPPPGGPRHDSPLR